MKNAVFLGGYWWLRLIGRASIIGVIQFDGSAASARKRLVRTTGVGVDVAPISSADLCEALTNVLLVKREMDKKGAKNWQK